MTWADLHTIVFTRRLSSRGRELAAAIIAGCGLILAVNGAAQLALGHGVGAALVIAGVAGSYGGLRLWRARPPATTQTIELTSGELRDVDRDCMLSPAANVRAKISIAWADGMGGTRLARVLSLSWGNDSVPIYRSYDKREIQALQQRLNERRLR